GTDGRTYPWGEDVDSTFANYGENVNDTTPVGAYPKGISPYGVYDMAGNVYEWVADWYDTNYYYSSPKANPTGPDSGDFRVLRSGSKDNDTFYLRAVSRVSEDPAFHIFLIGFRCARSP
ncbi:MAG TPA: SUMF1/EgtB/PvdO family nonheme iron enzyme, partial [Anaerolineales bacterium]|nr:SUMF1/EgtB/PvdO family nonheme iron enzyme [Anaerolineales bacterium]